MNQKGNGEKDNREKDNVQGNAPVKPCPFCGESMARDATKDKTEFLRCPRGCGEFWPDRDMLDDREAKAKMAREADRLRESLRWSVGGRVTWVLPLVPVRNHKGGGNKKAGRKRQKPWKRPAGWFAGMR